MFGTSTSGLLCLSTSWEEKLLSVSAASREWRTAVRYGRSDWDIVLSFFFFCFFCLCIAEGGEQVIDG